MQENKLCHQYAVRSHENEIKYGCRYSSLCFTRVRYLGPRVSPLPCPLCPKRRPGYHIINMSKNLHCFAFVCCIILTHRRNKNFKAFDENVYRHPTWFSLVCHGILRHVQLYACDVSEIKRSRFNELLFIICAVLFFLSKLFPACATSTRRVVFRGSKCVQMWRSVIHAVRISGRGLKARFTISRG